MEVVIPFQHQPLQHLHPLPQLLQIHQSVRQEQDVVVLIIVINPVVTSIGDVAACTVIVESQLIIAELVVNMGTVLLEHVCQHLQ